MSKQPHYRTIEGHRSGVKQAADTIRIDFPIHHFKRPDGHKRGMKATFTVDKGWDINVGDRPTLDLAGNPLPKGNA